MESFCSLGNGRKNKESWLFRKNFRSPTRGFPIVCSSPLGSLIIRSYQPRISADPIGTAVCETVGGGCENLENESRKKTISFSSYLIVGADGFEPPKSKDSRFTVCPIWPLWKTPLSLIICCAKVVYFFYIAKQFEMKFSPFLL